MPKGGGNGKWRDAEPGNTIAQKHGAFSPRVVDPVAASLVENVVELVPYLGDPSYEPAVWAWGRAEARVQVLAAWLDENGPLDEAGDPRPALAALLQFERLAMNHRTRLGLDPLSRAALGRDVAAQQLDLARLYDSMEQEAKS